MHDSLYFCITKSSSHLKIHKSQLKAGTSFAFRPQPCANCMQLIDMNNRRPWVSEKYDLSPPNSAFDSLAERMNKFIS